MARKKKRTKRRIRLRPAPFIVLLLLATIGAGLVASPMTVIRKVRVEGVPAWDQHRVQGILEGLKGKPCAQINRFSVQSDVQSDPAVRRAEFDRNLFGSAVLTVSYHVPVARFYNRSGVALSDEGVPYRCPTLPPDLPTVMLAQASDTGYLTVAQDFPALSIAKLAQQVSTMFPKREVRIEYGNGSGLCLNMGTSLVILGSTDGLDRKLGMLHDKLASDPDFLSRVKSYNLLDPKNPMTVPNRVSPSSSIKKAP